MGESALSDEDRRFLRFSEAFEREFIGQGDQRRTITDTLDLAWRLLEPFPDDELTRIKPDLLAEFRQDDAES